MGTLILAGFLLGELLLAGLPVSSPATAWAATSTINPPSGNPGASQNQTSGKAATPNFNPPSGNPGVSQNQTSGKAKPLNINSASVDQLRTQLKIKETYVRSIVKGRPYSRTEELVNRRIIPRATYEKIKTLVRAK